MTLTEQQLFAWSSWCGDSSTQQPLRQELIAAYSEPHRHYHTLQHLGECLDLLSTCQELTEAPDEIGLALWFHDAIYDPQRHDNEERSAAWAARGLSSLGIKAEKLARIVDLILVTAGHQAPVTADQQLMIDLDLAILGAMPERFAEYENQVRKEYGWVPPVDFATGRLKVLKGFSERDPLYLTPPLKAQLELRGRGNLQRAISHYESQLTLLSGQ